MWRGANWIGAAALAFSSVTLSAPAHAQDLDAPALGYNLAALRDWSAAQPFIDLMRTARPWVGNREGAWGAVNHKELVARGVIGENGLPRAVPFDVEALVSILAWDKSDRVSEGLRAARAGDYVLRYRGDGDLRVSGDVRVTSQSTGEIRFTNRAGGPIIIELRATDGGLDALTLTRAEDAAKLDGGMMFDPDWIAAIDDARTVRVMDWLAVNVDPASKAAQRVKSATAREIVTLCNLIGADPWVSIPNHWREARVRRFAREMRDTLDPNLSIRVEFSNETWNGLFPVHADLSVLSEAEWGARDPIGYGAKAATEMAMLWEEVFAEVATPKPALINVLSGQAANPDVLRQMLEASAWKHAEPERFSSPAAHFEEIAIASYFGAHVLRGETNVRDAVAALDRGQLDVWLNAALIDPARQSSLPDAAKNWRAHADLAAEFGMRLVAYEGGQHLQPVAHNLSAEDLHRLMSALADYMRGEAIAGHYATAWELWMEIGDGPFMHYNDVSAPSLHGVWGARSYVGDETPRAAMLDKLNAEASQAGVLPRCDCYSGARDQR